MRRLFKFANSTTLLIILLLFLTAARLGAQVGLYSSPKDYLADVAKGLTLASSLVAMVLTSWESFYVASGSSISTPTA